MSARRPISIYSDCSGVHRFGGSQVKSKRPHQFRLGFIIYDSELDFTLMKRCYKFSAKRFFYKTDYAEAFACLFGLYYFDQYFNHEEYKPIILIDSKFVRQILEGSLQNEYEEADSVIPGVFAELRRFYHKFDAAILRVSGNKNKAHKISRECRVL